MFDTDAALYAQSRRYIESIATPRKALAAACGTTEADMLAIDAAGALPAPTYVVFDAAIRSPIRSLGEPPDEGGEAYYGPAVVSWLRRAALLCPHEASLSERLQTWFAASFRTALEANADARGHAWSHLFAADGVLNETAVVAEAAMLHADWMKGGWAVCLRRWNGHHVVTKDMERARIDALTQSAARDLSADERLQLCDAIERLDSVMLPFAPYERPHGTPGLFIDRMRTRYGV